MKINNLEELNRSGVPEEFQILVCLERVIFQTA